MSQFNNTGQWGSGRPDTPKEWFMWMDMKLASQSSEANKYTDYYDSKAVNLAFAQQTFSKVFGNLFTGWQDNFTQLIVDSISERLSIKGFRFGDSDAADEDAAEIWQRNFLDAESNAAHIDALVRGEAFLYVGHEDEEDKKGRVRPVIVPESSESVVVQYAPGSRRKVVAGFKKYYDDWGGVHATLWTPDFVFQSEWSDKNGWNDPSNSKNALGEVPIVPLQNRSRLSSSPKSELTNIIPIQDAINKISADAIVASEFMAYPQRVLTGVEVLDDDATDEEKAAERKAMLKTYVDRIITLDSTDARWGQFDPADLTNYVALIDMLVQHMASQSRVPFHYFLLNGGQAPSGESITAAEAGLVAKAKERMLHFGESWEQAMRMAFKVMDDPRSEEWAAETIWGDPEHRSQGALADALLKLKGIGVPDKQLQEEYGFSPTQIARFKEMREEELEEQVAAAKDMAEAMPQPAMGGAPGQPGAATKPTAGGTAKPTTAKAAPKSASAERKIEKANRA